MHLVSQPVAGLRCATLAPLAKGDDDRIWIHRVPKAASPSAESETAEAMAFFASLLTIITKSGTGCSSWARATDRCVAQLRQTLAAHRIAKGARSTKKEDAVRPIGFGPHPLEVRKPGPSTGGDDIAIEARFRPQPERNGLERRLFEISGSVYVKLDAWGRGPLDAASAQQLLAGLHAAISASLAHG